MKTLKTDCKNEYVLFLILANEKDKDAMNKRGAELDLEKEIKRKLKNTIETEFLDALYKELMEWWKIEMILKWEKPITWVEICDKIDCIRTDLKHEKRLKSLKNRNIPLH